MSGTSGRVLSAEEVAASLPEGWTGSASALCCRIVFGRYAVGLALVAAIGEAAEDMDHHPDLDLRYRHLDIRLHSHDVEGVTRRDLRLAARIDAVAAELGLTPEGPP